jgi:Flp pilus assembly protein CpaB
VELEYSDKNSRRSKVYIAVGVIVALVVAATVFFALQASRLAPAADVELRTVVVAAADIAARTPITEADVTTRELPADPTNAHAFTSVDEAIGRVTGGPVASGQLMGPTVLASTAEGMTYSILAPGEAFDPNGPDWRAVSVNVPASNAVGGTLASGQLVDLIVTMPLNPATGEEAPEEEEAADDEEADDEGPLMSGPSTKVTLQSLPILFRDGDIYILRADLETVEKIAELVASGGHFTFVLRPEEDERTAETEGSTIDQLVEEYGFPLPRAIEGETQSPAAGN